jgi:hypothetical protein
MELAQNHLQLAALMYVVLNLQAFLSDITWFNP